MTEGTHMRKTKEGTPPIVRYELSPAKVKKLRIKRGLSLRELGNKIGIQKSSVHMYETGENNPSLDKFFELAYALRVQPTELCKQRRGRPASATG